MTEIHQIEAAVVAEITQDTRRYDQIRNVGVVDVHVDVLRNGESITIASHERYAGEPWRSRGTSTVTDAASLVKLLAMPAHSGSVLFADENSGRLTAVVNYLGGWRDHRIALQLTTSEQFARWMQASGKFYRQSEFAELVEDGLADIVEPDSADMLEIAQSFQATTSVQFESGTRLTSGAVRFRYHEDVDAKAGRAGEMDVPSSFTLRVPVWRGGAVVEFQANLRYRISREGLALGIKIPGLDEVLRLAFEATVIDVERQLDEDDEHTLVYGPAPAAVDPLP